MNNERALIIAAIVLTLAMVGKAGQMTYAHFKQRGIRNNNPGNIRRSNDAWQGLAPVQNDAAFFQFESPEWGIRALTRVLKNYQARHGLNTIRGIINRWAPPTENDTAAYIRNMENWTGLDADTPLDLSQPFVLGALVPAIIRMENGIQPYPDALIAKGISLA